MPFSVGSVKSVPAHCVISAHPQVISVTSNLIPDLMYDLMFGGGNIELRDSLLPLMGWLFHEPNPIPLNTALAQLGIIRPIFR